MPLPRVGSYVLQAFLETWPVSTFTESITLFDASAVVSSWDTSEQRLSSDCQNHKLSLNMSRPLNEHVSISIQYVAISYWGGV